MRSKVDSNRKQPPAKDFLVSLGDQVYNFINPLTHWFQKKLAPAEDVEITAISSPSANGGSGATLFVIVVARRPEFVRYEFVVRLKPTNYKLFLRDNFDAQYQLMHYLHEHSNVPVPKVYFFESDPGIVGTPFFVMDKIVGDIPSDNPTFHAAGFLFNATIEQRRALWDSALQVMAEVAKVNIGSLPEIVVCKEGESGPEENLRHWTESLRWVYGDVVPNMLEATISWLHTNMPQGLKTGLSWGDARVGNMIFDNWKCVAAIDWETATLAGPELDLAHWLLMDDFWSKYLGVEPLKGLPSRNETVLRWEELTGFKAKHLAWHEVLAAYRLCLIYERVCQLKGAVAGLRDDSGETLGMHQLREVFTRHNIIV